MKENQCIFISWCKFRGFHFASLSPLKLCFLLVYYIDFKVQHPKITCKEKSKILNENHQKDSNEAKMETVTYIRQEKSQLEFSYQNKTH